MLSSPYQYGPAPVSGGEGNGRFEEDEIMVKGRLHRAAEGAVVPERHMDCPHDLFGLEDVVRSLRHGIRPDAELGDIPVLGPLVYLSPEEIGILIISRDVRDYAGPDRQDHGRPQG